MVLSLVFTLGHDQALLAFFLLFTLGLVDFGSLWLTLGVLSTFRSLLAFSLGLDQAPVAFFPLFSFGRGQALLVFFPLDSRPGPSCFLPTILLGSRSDSCGFLPGLGRALCFNPTLFFLPGLDQALRFYLTLLSPWVLIVLSACVRLSSLSRSRSCSLLQSDSLLAFSPT